MTPEERLRKNNEQIEKQNAGIRDLMRDSRTLVDAQANSWALLPALTERIDKLTENVNRFLAGLQKPNGSH